MKKTISLQIPMGYKLEDKIEYVKIWQAESYLLSKRVRRYTKAVRHDTDAELHSRWLICPYCGKEYVANVTSPAFAKSDNRQYLHFSKPTKEQIKNWGSLQLTLFDEHDNSELFIASAIDVSGKFTCLNCENESYESSSKRQVMVTLNRKKISVKCEVVQIDEILSLGWIKEKEVRISFPIYEILTFDCHKGKVHVRIENSQGNVLCQRDVSAYPEQLKGGAVHKVLTQNKVVLRNVKRLFQEVWGVNLPYCWKQLDIPALFKMTMFVGYHKYGDSYEYDTNNHWKKCECGAVDEKDEHSYGEWVITKPETTSEKGSKEKTCSICGYKITEEIPVAIETPDDEDQNEDVSGNSPETGDNSNIVLWFTLLLLSSIGILVAIIFGKKKVNN